MSIETILNDNVIASYMDMLQYGIMKLLHFDTFVYDEDCILLACMNDSHKHIQFQTHSFNVELCSSLILLSSVIIWERRRKFQNTENKSKFLVKNGNISDHLFGNE